MSTASTPTESARDYRLVVVNAGTSDPSSTRLLADRAAAQVAEFAAADGTALTVDVIELRALASEIASAMVTGLLGPGLEEATERLRLADGIIAATPVYKADQSGLFTSFWQVLDRDLVIGTPVILAATAGTARHALVVDERMRSSFAYLRTLAVPTSLFAASEDWNDEALPRRIGRAARELWTLMQVRFGEQVRATAWQAYQHDFGSAGGTEFEVDFSSDLMRLATGGSATSGV